MIYLLSFLPFLFLLSACPFSISSSYASLFWTRLHCTAPLALSSQPSSLTLPSLGLRCAPLHQDQFFAVCPTTDGWMQSRKHGPLASFPLYRILSKYSQVPLFTLLSVATNLTLDGKFLLSPVTCCSQNTELDRDAY